MTQRSLIFLIFFAVLLVSPYLVEPAYYGFLVAFTGLGIFRMHWDGVGLFKLRMTGFAGFVLLNLLIAACVVTWKAPVMWDLFRDLGAIFAFVVGLRFFRGPYRSELPRDAMIGLSLMGVLVALVTMGAALAALVAGASAYIWRGVYVPWGHTWIPFAMVANIGLASIDPPRATRYLRRAVLCILATFASLSRTDLLLEGVLLMVLAYRNRQWLLRRASGLLTTVSVVVGLAVLVVVMLSLPAVQQRLDAGVGSNDQSLEWRIMEHVALSKFFAKGAWPDWVLGFGLGARMPLPEGILDFNGNSSIPQLHDSFATIALKSGALGLFLLGLFLIRKYKQSIALRGQPGEEYRQAGRWIVLLVLGKALTLQGLSEWSQLVFFGVGCMLMLAGKGGGYTVIVSSAQGVGAAAGTIPARGA